MAKKKTWREVWTENGKKRVATREFTVTTWYGPRTFKVGDVFWYESSNHFDICRYRTDEEKNNYFTKQFYPEVFRDFEKA